VPLGIRRAAVLAALALTGCGSTTAVADLPPPAGPDRSPPLSALPVGRVVPLDLVPAVAPSPRRAAVDGAVAVVRGRRRVLEYRGERANAGAGPTHVVAGASRLYVVDTTGDALLVFRWEPELVLDRRVALPGAPYAIAVDRERGRLWVTLTATNEVVELAAGTRPRVLRTLPSVRQPNRVAVDSGSRRLVVRGADAAQLLDLAR